MTTEPTPEPTADDPLTTHETKAARLMVLYRLRIEGQLAGLSDVDLARAFATRRETIWKDKQALKRADALYNQVMARQPWADKADLTVQEAAAAPAIGGRGPCKERDPMKPKGKTPSCVCNPAILRALARALRVISKELDKMAGRPGPNADHAAALRRAS